MCPSRDILSPIILPLFSIPIKIYLIQFILAFLMEELCETCVIGDDYFRTIHKFFENNEVAKSFLREHKVLPTVVMCPKCSLPCTFNLNRNRWRCHGSIPVRKRKKIRCTFSISDVKGTFMDNVHIEPWKIVLFVNHWLSKMWCC